LRRRVRSKDRALSWIVEQPRKIMANALLAFDAKHLPESQQLLIELVAIRDNYPKPRCGEPNALEQGNQQFAIALARQQIRQTGDP